MSRYTNIVVVLVLFLLNFVFCEDLQSKSLCDSNESDVKCSSLDSADATQLQGAAAATRGDEVRETDTANDIHTSERNSRIHADTASIAETNSSKPVSTSISVATNSSTPSNATTADKKPEHTDTKEQPRKDIATDLNPAAGVAHTEGVEMADAILQIAGGQEGDGTATEQEGGTSNLTPAQTVALAEGIVMAGAIFQLVNGLESSENGDGKPGDLSPAQTVALAEGVEIVAAVVQAAKESEPEVNALWRATLEAESSWKQNDKPEAEGLDMALIGFLVCVMIVVGVTGSAAGLVLYSRLRGSVEEDEQSQNMYVLIRDSDSQSAFVECPLGPTESYGVSYTFPRAENGTFSC